MTQEYQWYDATGELHSAPRPESADEQLLTEAREQTRLLRSVEDHRPVGPLLITLSVVSALFFAVALWTLIQPSDKALTSACAHHQGVAQVSATTPITVRVVCHDGTVQR